MAGRGGRTWSQLLLAGIAVFALVLLLYGWFGRSPSGGADVRVVYMGGLLVLLLAGVLGRFSARPASSWSQAFGQIVIWLAVGLVLVGGYSYRAEMRRISDRLLGELDPAHGQATGSGTDAGTGGTMLFTMAADGQFRIEARVGGVPVRFILDTGASDVMLSPADARRLGFDPAALAYTRSYQTANGAVMGAPVVLPAVDIGAIHMSDVAASVLEKPSDMSLLGMSFLRRLKGYQVQGSNLILTQ
jgi:aspartyl protease family protein